MERSEFNKRMISALNEILKLSRRRFFGSRRIEKIILERIHPLMTRDHK